jgi:putative membrane protein
MGFIDPLAVMLLSLGISAALISAFFFMAARGEDLKELVIPAFAFGFFDFISGFIMSELWPLPGAYNMLFGDPILILGLLLMAGSIMIYKQQSLRTLSIPGVMLGIYLFIESAAIINFKLESGDNLLAAMGLYIMSGVSAVYSVILFIKPENNRKYLYYIAFILLALTALIALFIGYEAIYGHLQAPP